MIESLNSISQTFVASKPDPQGRRAPGHEVCPSCGSPQVNVFHEVKGVPVHSCLLLAGRDQALRFPKRDIVLGLCESCGFIANVAFDPAMLRYSSGYEEQQSFSPRFNTFAYELATRLVKRYNLQEKTVVEIGCGKGDFLLLLCELGENHGVGVDPSYVPERTRGAAAQRVTFIQDFYSERYAYVQGDLICCRHTLEHIHNTRDFVRTVRQAVGDRSDSIIFFEVPDVGRVLREIAFWDIYYEHCSYFSLGSLARLFRSCGFEVLDLAKGFDDQYLLLEARPANGPTKPHLPHEDDLEQVRRDVKMFAQQQSTKLQSWRCQIEQIRSKGRRAAIWGSGSKCVAFLSTLSIQDEIDVIVDINPHRHGKYLAGSGKKISSPEVLPDYRPDTVIVMNPIYCDEIRQDLNRMGLNPEMVAV